VCARDSASIIGVSTACGCVCERKRQNVCVTAPAIFVSELRENWGECVRVGGGGLRGGRL